MKLKYTLIPAVLAAVLALAACGGTATPTTPDETQPTEIATEASAEEPTEEAKQAEQTAFEEKYGCTIELRTEVPGDTSGRWRTAVVRGKSIVDMEAAAVEYYRAFFAADDEIHFVVDLSQDITYRILKLGGQLEVETIERNEESNFDALHLTEGDHVRDVYINIETGEVRDMTP